MDDSAAGNPLADYCYGRHLSRKHVCKRPTAALAHCYDGLPIARPVSREPAINPICGQVFGSDVASKIGAIDLCGSPIAADNKRFGGRRQSLAQFVSQYERCLVLDV